jgi:hypothetical protein
MSTEEPTLFDASPYEQPIPLRPTKTAGQRRNARIAQKIELGRHPLAGVAEAGDLLLGPADKTCGDCDFRTPQDGDRSYPKCRFGAYERLVPTVGRAETRTVYPRVNASILSDCRKGWPACRDFQPKAGGGRG